MISCALVATSDLAISMRSVRKTFGSKVAVESLDLGIPRDMMVGLIGPNGAGKTTSIRMIMSILFPDSGELSVLGKASALESKDRIGYLPEERGVYKKMRVAPFLRHMGRLKGMPIRGLDAKITAWLERVQLPDVAKKRCEELSKGMQQKIQFIASVLHEPDLLILDEPFSGLDPVNMRLLRDLIDEQHREGRTVIFSTHVMSQAEQVCDHIIMINQGQKVLDDSLASIRRSHETRSIAFKLADNHDNRDRHENHTPSNVDSLARRHPDMITAVRKTPQGYEADFASDADPSRVIAAITATTPVHEITVKKPSLEDLFLDIVGRSQTAIHTENLGAESVIAANAETEDPETKSTEAKNTETDDRSVEAWT